MRFFLLLLSGLLVGSTAHAQLSLRAGTTWAGQTSNFFRSQMGGNSFRATSQVGYQLGVTYGLPLGQHWTLVPELSFSRERQQVHVTGGAPDLSLTADYTLTQSLLNLPVLARRQWGRVYLEGGPQVSWLVGGRGQGVRTYSGPTASFIYYDPRVEQAAIDSYSRLDAGVCLGVGVRVLAGLGLNVRAYQGLAGRDKGSDSFRPVLPKGSSQAYRHTLQLALTYELARR
jgi:hypothetical protein